MATDTKPETASEVDVAVRTQVLGSVFAMAGQGEAAAARQVPAMTMPKMESPPMIPSQPARVRRSVCVEAEPEAELTTWRGWIGKTLLIGSVVCAAYFFLKATPSSPFYDQPARSTMVASRTPAGPRLVTEEIQDIKVGDRTVGRNPLREQVDPNAPEPDPKTWRKLVLLMLKEEERELRVNLLRPSDWIEATGATAGGAFFLNLPEMGAVGNAYVEAIEPCPPIKRGPGNIVTGTFHHEADPNTKILQVEFTNGAFIKGVTENHPFWSEDRQDFVPVGELQKGDHVRFNGGVAAVTSIASRFPYPGELLFNLEVHNEHVYQVTTAGLLVHNSCAQLERGMHITNKVGAGAARAPRHHVFPEQFRDWFKARKFDIDKVAIEFDQGTHSALHTMKWNENLMKALTGREAELGRQLTTREIWTIGYRQMRLFHIGDMPIVHY